MGGKRKAQGKGRKGGGKGDRRPPQAQAGEDGESSDAGSEARARKMAKSDKDVWRETGPVSMENASYEAYYKRQNICAESEWASLLEALRTGLPVALRINGMRAGAAALGARLEEIKAACEGTARSHYSPERLAWYPDGAAWQWRSLERKRIKKDPGHAMLKDFLAQRERSGLITRQEVVSMLPPLFLEPQPHDLVLDLCAAPGSKTSQILELMHRGAAAPTGLVVANELQWRRANMLAHQVGRLGSPCAAIVNMDAQYFPDLWEPDAKGAAAGDGSAGAAVEGARQLRFDRILADVPCSGDGTMRKTPYIWSSWTRRDGLALHIRQLNILYRGLDMLRVGGRLVYSTCSLNPMEDEAVVAAALLRHGDALQLVPPPAGLAGLRVGKGLRRWAVPNPKEEDVFYEAYDEVPQEHRMGKMRLLPSMFPPKASEESSGRILDQVHECCCRMLPHLMDTGGFFVAAFEKRAEFKPSARAKRISKKTEREVRAGEAVHEINGDPAAENAVDLEQEAAEAGENTVDLDQETAEAETTGSAQAVDDVPGASSRPQRYQPLRPISKEYGDIAERIAEQDVAEIAAFYGFDGAFLTRLRARGNAERQLYMQSPGALRLLKSQARLPTRMVLSGVLVLQRSDSYHMNASPWQLVQEGLPALCASGALTKRRLSLHRDLLLRLLQERELPLAEIEAAASTGNVSGLETCRCEGGASASLRPGSVAVENLLRDDEEAALRPQPRVVLTALISEAMLEVVASNADMEALREDLEGQPSVDAILGSEGLAPEEPAPEDSTRMEVEATPA